MSQNAPGANGPAMEPTLREIDMVVEEIARLSRASLAPGEFYAGFLRHVVTGLAALGGTLWVRDPSSGHFRAAHELAVPKPASGVEAASLGGHGQWVEQALETNTPLAIPPGLELPGGHGYANPTDRLLLFCPWNAGGESAGVVEICQRPTGSPSLQRGYLRFLEVACELLADYERNLQLSDLRLRAAAWGQLDQFAQQVHASLDLVPAAYATANETRRILNCDRVSVLVRRGSRCQVVAISGMETFDRRSNSVRLLERLATAAVPVGEAIWYPATGESEYPPQVSEPLDAYLDECHARGLAIVPLEVERPSGALPRAAGIGVLVLERFYATIDEPLRKTVMALRPHAALAIHNALEMERLPLGRVLRRLRSIRESGRGGWPLAAGLALLAIAGLVAVLVLVPADFTVDARGELQPLQTHDVFAPADGVVRELRAESGAKVEANQVLLALRRPELDLEFKRVWGELQTARKKLAAVETEQLQNRREDEAQRKRSTELTAQQEELRELIGSLEAQYAILQRQQAELEVRSPIAGELLTWSAEELLQSRPVARGQVLLTVANLDGPWGLELRIPDRRMLHVLEARRQAARPLDVSFTLATSPGQVLRGSLDRVGMRTELTESEGAVVLATVRIDRDEVPELVPGAGVVARVHCGRRAIGYVWLHDLIDAIRSWFLF